MTDFSHKAFAAFTLALAASAWALFTEIGKPFLPSVPIVVYAVFLYANRDAVAAIAADTLKDSPYFLGFLLTMFGMFKIFNDVSFNFSLFGRNPALMTQEVGGAVMSTIVGLFCRQALLSLIPEPPAKEDDRLAELTAAVTSHAVAFELARQDFFREMAERAAAGSAPAPPPTAVGPRQPPRTVAPVRRAEPGDTDPWGWPAADTESATASAEVAMPPIQPVAVSSAGLSIEAAVAVAARLAGELVASGRVTPDAAAPVVAPPSPPATPPQQASVATDAPPAPYFPDAGPTPTPPAPSSTAPRMPFIPTIADARS